jgi:hypothetical protein
MGPAAGGAGGGVRAARLDRPGQPGPVWRVPFTRDSLWDADGPRIQTLGSPKIMAHTQRFLLFKPNARLTQDQAIDIFNMKSSALTAVKIAVSYGISEKAVRDIWKGRTWSRETRHLDTTSTVVLKKVGRPIGRRDQKPRKKRVVTAPNHSAFPTVLPASGTAQHIIFSKAIENSVGSGSLHTDPAMTVSWLEQMNAGRRESQSDRTKTNSAGYFSPFSIDSSRAASPSCEARVDDQLSAWDESIWINSQSPDPFRDDWAPTSCPFF